MTVKLNWPDLVCSRKPARLKLPSKESLTFNYYFVSLTRKIRDPFGLMNVGRQDSWTMSVEHCHGNRSMKNGNASKRQWCVC